MKLHANMYHVNKQPSLEEGSMKYEIMDERCTSTIDRKSNRCNRWLQLMKVILYIELILFIGWIGCVFITNYYQPHNSNGTAEQHGASEWSRDPKSPDATVTSNSISQYTTKRSTNQDDFETTTVKGETKPEFVSKNENVDSHVEMTTATKIIKPYDSDEKLMVHWLHSWAKGRGNWDDSSSESTSSQDALDWDPLSTEKSAFNRNTDEPSLIEKHFGVTNEDDEMELNYLLSLPLWHNVLFTSDSLDKSVDSDKDSFDESTEDHRPSRQTRSTDDESSSSSSSSSEETNKPRGEPNAANGESSNEDECAAILDDEGNVTNEARDGNDWVSLLKEADIPECEKTKVAKSVTVDRCGKIAVTCVEDEKDDTPMKHHRHTRNAETKNIAEETCKQEFTLWLQNLKAWRARLVKEESAGQMVQEVYQNIQEYVFTLIKQAIVDRTSGKPRKTEEEWHNGLISMKRNIAELMDSEHRNLLVTDNELTSKIGASLGEIVETAVDIRMDCQEILSTHSPTLHMMTEGQKNCLQVAETMTLLDNKFAAEVVPGESTNSAVRQLRRLFKPHALVLIHDIIQYKKSRNVPSDMSSPTDLTDEQLTSYMHDLKQRMLQFAKYTDLRTQFGDRVSPTAEETILLREMVDYYSHMNESCSRAHLEELMVASNTRKTRAVSVDPPIVVTCTLDNDDVQFMQERKERLDRYNQSIIVNSQTVRIRSFLDAIEERLTGTTPTENSDEDIKPTYMSYIKALNVFMGNTSTELKNEGYRLLRDIVLESKYFDVNETLAEGYDLDEMIRNWTVSCLIHINDNYTAETILMAVIKLSETVNLHYTGAEDNKTCGDEFTPIYGTFTYVGEEPQKSIVRKWRHIFQGIVKLYFDIHNPQALPSCENDKEGSESSTTTGCISKDDITQFDQERQERLDRYNRSEEHIISDSRTEPFLDAIEERLNGITPTEDSDDEPAPPYMRYMNAFNIFAGNSSTDLKEEGYRLLRDIVLELKFMGDNDPAALEGYDMDTIMEAWGINCLKDIGDTYTAETILIAAMKVAEGIDLRYSGLDSEKKCGEQLTPTYGTFTYVGQAPEKSFVRRWRHIFNTMARLYFRMYNPEVLPKLNCKEESRTTETNTGEAVRRMGKRSIGYPSRRSATAVECTADDDDVQFMQERKQRLDRHSYSIIVNIGTVRVLSFLDAIEKRLNGATPTENSDEDMNSTYMPYITALNVFMGNTSTELKNEGYRLFRDIVLESKYLEHNVTAAEDYDLHEMEQNWMNSCFMHINDNYTAETILMAVIKLGETLNLHYTGAENNKTCGDEFTPVYGTFTYVGEEPQKSIVRKWRHIFQGIVKLYFDIHNPQALPSCENDKGGSESSTTAGCTSKDDIAQFGQERQERSDRFNRSEERTISDSRTESILDAIEEKLNGVTPTEDSDDKPAPIYMPYMNALNVFIGNSSTDLKEEGYRLLRDIILELKFMDDNKPAAFEGYEMSSIIIPWTANCLDDIGDNYTAATVLIAAMKVAEGIDLHYSGLDSEKKCGEPFTPTYGTFTYVGQAPEKSLVRRWRHIFNTMARLYFRMYNPEVIPKLNCEEESRTTETNTGEAVRRMGKRSIGYPNRRSDNSVDDVDEKDFGNDDNGRLIKVRLDLDAEPRNFDLSQDSFIDKMEMLSAHIDRLHDMYQKYNELNDDYVSEEFPVDRTSNYKY